eukprot:7389790-Prymnesium_polylepis.2
MSDDISEPSSGADSGRASFGVSSLRAASSDLRRASSRSQYSFSATATSCGTSNPPLPRPSAAPHAAVRVWHEPSSRSAMAASRRRSSSSSCRLSEVSCSLRKSLSAPTSAAAGVYSSTIRATEWM